MSESPNDDLVPGAYRALGLISNPFSTGEPFTDASFPGVELVAHAAANRVVVEVDAAACKPQAPVIWVDKAGNLPLSYYVAPLAETLGVLGRNGSATDVIVAYVPLDMMRIGRVRAVLSVIAERVAGARVDLTIAFWMRRMLAEIDTELPEHVAIAETDLAALDAALEDDPSATVERYFGPWVAEREGVEDLEVLMRLSTARRDSLETDPTEEAEASVDEAPEDELSEVFTQDVVAALARENALQDGEEVVDEAAESPAEPDDGLPRVDDLIAYVVAYTSAHLSPVIGRALRVYRAQGYTSMTQELKVTKAPTKTLVATMRFATCRYRKVVILFDRFDVWANVPDDLRLKILGTMSQLRWALRDSAVLVYFAGTGQTPELEEQFSTALRLTWDMPGLVELEGRDPAFDAAIAQSWVDAATLKDKEPIVLAEGPLAGLVEASDGSLRHAASLLAAAIDDAAARGIAQIDDAAIAAARKLLSSGN